MKFSTIDYEVKDGIATILLNRPDNLNSVNSTMSKELPKAWKLFNEDNSAIVAILSNHGTKSFCTGADLDDLPELVGMPLNLTDNDDRDDMSPDWRSY